MAWCTSRRGKVDPDLGPRPPWWETHKEKLGRRGVEGRTGGSALEPGGGGARGRRRRGKHATVSFLASKCRLKLALSRPVCDFWIHGFGGEWGEEQHFHRVTYFDVQADLSLFS